jgi:hypothetical protein
VDTDPSAAPPGSLRTLEEVTAAVAGQGTAAASRPWPLYGVPVDRFHEDRYQRACHEQAMPAYVLCVRTQLMDRADDEYAGAVFRMVTGHAPDRAWWHHAVERLRTRQIDRDGLLADLLSHQAVADRRVIVFDEGQLRPLVEILGIGLQDVLRLLLGLAKRQARRRFAMVVNRLARIPRR